ncbi:ribonuclease H [Trifolium pratense]|uniref:Ribonuclease H n=1 Tax=Trifolium pratense TaxID=57577 RepID=A0A2K3L665_TRIPR|nr:ribonuclease H [Trifolium pratense]
MAKAYDRVEWTFLKATMEARGFPTVKFSIRINGHPSQEFSPKRGLRQGDPLSPYLFIMCADVLSSLISKAHKENALHGVNISPTAPEITHLLFDDDSLMFCRANKVEVTKMKDIIQTYQEASGQMVNYSKSEMVFSKGTTAETLNDIAQILPMKILSHFTEYLGLPTDMERSKKKVFNFIEEKIWNKLKGWKEKKLSFARRGTLIKAVAQAIPTYLMCSFLIPKGVCEQLEKMICKFCGEAPLTAGRSIGSNGQRSALTRIKEAWDLGTLEHSMKLYLPSKGGDLLPNPHLWWPKFLRKNTNQKTLS